MAPFLGGVGGPAPNGLPNNGPAILCIDWAFFSLSTTVVILRLATRTFIVPSLGWDDLCIALAQTLNTVGKYLTIEEVANGLGLHQWQIPPDNYSRYLKYNYLDWCQVFLTLALSKISICLFLLRLSQFEKLRIFLKSLIAFIMLTHLPLFFVIVFQCSPVSKNWHPERPGSCFSREALEAITNTQGVISIITDFICVGFPIVLLRKTTIKLKTKIGLCLLMGLGLLTAIACIVRVCYSWQIQAYDVTWVGIPNAIARIAEVNLGNVAACIPILKPLIRHCRARLTGNDPHNMLHRSSRNNHTMPCSAFGKPSLSTNHPSWYSKYIPTSRHSRACTTRGSRHSELISGVGPAYSASGCGGGHDKDQLHRPLGPYSEIEISKTTYTEAHGHAHRQGDRFDFALGPDSPVTATAVHQRAIDNEKGIIVNTDIRIEHLEGRLNYRVP